VFRPSPEEEALQKSIEHVGAEIRKQGGDLKDTADLGKRTFARPFRKGHGDAGRYVRFAFAMDPARIDSFRERFRHREDVIRTQIVLAGPPPASAPAAAPDRGPDREEAQGTWHR